MAPDAAEIYYNSAFYSLLQVGVPGSASFEPGNGS
jgi:hypothetical protein